MSDRDLQSVGNVIRDAQYNNGNWAQDLEYNPVSGTFNPVARGQGTGDGTAILENGFAC